MNSQQRVRAAMFSFLDADTTSIAHKKTYLLGVLHRDISPANITITNDRPFDRRLLIDWDLCKVKDDGHINDNEAGLSTCNSSNAI
ncbi:hypothetical protein BGW80DRAFT_1533830 [Lactifluus volemus]|nr:hypothetical protein BGW80DRAFT_1533830 [Lactifluus volemus]